MIRLGQVALTSDRAVRDARERLRQLALDVDLDPVAATRLATVVSEVGRAARGGGGDATLTVALDGVHGVYALVVQVDGAVGPPEAALARRFFARVDLDALDDGRTRLTGAWRPSAGLAPSARLVDHARALLERPSRAALMEAIEDKNRALEVHKAQLEVAIEEARRASEAKSEFLASMSHELRTPMNSILGFTRRLLKRLEGKVGERDLDALQTVERNARHLLALINDILDLSKIEAGKMELQPETADVVMLVRDVVRQSESLLEGRPQTLALALPDQPIPMVVDPTKVRQVVTNLVSNAIKYSQRGTITVRVAPVRDASLGAALEIAVRDQGEGMTPEQQAQLFQRFTRLKTAATRRASGTGLGLAISGQFVAMHGGRIDVSSVVGEGSEFRVLLPMARGGAPAEATERPRGAAPRRPAPTAGSDPLRPRVLCVDDDPDILEFLRLTFRDASMGVELAAGVEEALAKVRVRRPDLVCVDLHMRDGSGFAVLEALKQDPATASLPVVFISGDEEGRRALDSGARAFLRKPVDPDSLLSTVQQLLSEGIERVLVVEDAPDSQKLLVNTFGDLRVPVSVASNGQEALEILAERTVSVVVLDLMMPVMDGFEFLARMRDNPAWREIPAVVLTGMDLTEAQLAKLSALNSAILHKGADTATATVEAVLAARAR